MSLRGYMQHGRRHGPNGSDPIPGTPPEILGGGGSVTIAKGHTASLPWDSSSALLDITTPDFPTFLAGGIYAVGVAVEVAIVDVLSEGGFFDVVFDLGGGFSPLGMYSWMGNGSQPGGVVSLSLTRYVDAGDHALVQVTNNDGVSSLDFAIGRAIIQRIA